MANMREELEAAVSADGETIEAMVVGHHDRTGYRQGPREDENVVLDAAVGLSKIDKEYCPFWAWTPSKVYFVAEYDGGVWLTWVPRHPVAGQPDFSGQT